MLARAVNTVWQSTQRKQKATRRVAGGSFSKNKACLFSSESKATSTIKSASSHIPPLPILNKISQHVNIPKQHKTLVVGIQHMLPTTASLFDAFIDQLGVDPSNMYFAGKSYSSHPATEEYIRSRGINLMPTKSPKLPWQFDEQMKATVENMWDVVQQRLKKDTSIEKVIIFDEGGYCEPPRWVRLRFPCAGLEQTQYGFHNKTQGLKLYPIVDVARSATKKRLESPLIANAIIRRIAPFIKELDVDAETVFGVVGNGAIGSSIVRYLLSLGHTVNIYDESPHAFQNILNEKCYRLGDVRSLIHSSNIIFGCTGKDITAGIDVRDIVNENTTFASCSSQTIEFKTLLESLDSQSLVTLKTENFSYLNFSSKTGAPIKIVENGFPINFDKTALCDPVADMELTRALLFSGFIQAVLSATKPINDGKTLNKGGSVQMLNPYLQQFIVNEWRKNPYSAEYSEKEFDVFNHIDWIIGNSQGEHQASSLDNSFTNSIELNRALKL